MTKATENELAKLHKKVAVTMSKALEQSGTATLLLDRYIGDDEYKIPQAIIDFLEEVCVVNPTLLNAATKFLKDNDITVDISDSRDLQELDDLIEARKANARARSNVADIKDYLDGD